MLWASLCLWTGLWWPLVKCVREVSELVDCSLGFRAMSEVGEGFGRPVSGTESKYSFFKAQVQRDPWEQQQVFTSGMPALSDVSIALASARSFCKPTSGHSSLLCGFSPHSHLTWEARALRRPLQWGHCETGRPFLLICVRGRSYAIDQRWDLRSSPAVRTTGHLESLPEC